MPSVVSSRAWSSAGRPVVSRALDPVIRRLRVALVGAGALGSAVAEELARLDGRSGVRSVLVVDPDQLEPRNVALSEVYSRALARGGSDVLTRNKALILAEALGSQGSLQWSTAGVEIADVGWGRLQDADVLLSCTDSALARVETTLAARRLRLPMLDAGVLGADFAQSETGGRIAWFSPEPEAACYLCGFSETRRAELLSYAAATSLGCGPLAETPAMGAAPQVPVSTRQTALALVEALGLFARGMGRTEQGRSWAARMAGKGEHSRMERHSLLRRKDCPWHDSKPGRLIALPFDEAMRGLWVRREAMFGGWRLQFAWPVCVRARCGVCGADQPRAQRLAAMRRRGVCAACGSVGTLRPLRCVSSVGPEDPEAACTPRQLGLPDQHLYELRQAFHPAPGGEVPA